jgi:cohesin complex subunit SA-1/2
LRYVGWVLSDSTTLVRLEAVKALSGVYSQVDYITSLNHFTERFKPRLLEMATSDTDLGTRVSVIHVLDAINRHSLLEDDEREKLCLLLFDEEAKVRKAVSGFVRGVWEDAVEERLVGRQANEKDRERVGVKALAALLVKWGRTLDKAIGDNDDDNDVVDKEGINPVATSTETRVREVAALLSLGHKGRMALAVEALWDEVEPMGDWEGLLDVLLLDHSAAGENIREGPRGPRANGKGNTSDLVVDEVWRLEEIEESLLLEVLVATLRRVEEGAASGKKVRCAVRFHVYSI